MQANRTIFKRILLEYSNKYIDDYNICTTFYSICEGEPLHTQHFWQLADHFQAQA